MHDYYLRLQAPRSATQQELKAAYLKQALECHPDKHLSNSRFEADLAEARFKALREAYECLSDPKARQAYDLGGRAGVEAAASGSGRRQRSYNHRTARGSSSSFRWSPRYSSIELGIYAASAILALGGFAALGLGVDALWASANRGKLQFKPVIK